MKKRIGIIFGGNSVEHEISILSAIQASYAIDSSKYDIYQIYITKQGNFWVGKDFHDLDTFKKDEIKHYEVTFYSKNSKAYLKGIKRLPRKYKKPIDVILPIVHGKNAEDGSLAGYFNILNVPYAASSILSSSIIQNKIYTKITLKEIGIKMLDYEVVHYKDYINNEEKVRGVCLGLHLPLIIKPVSLV